MTLKQWIEQSPNKSPNNKLIRGEDDQGVYYYWNLKWNDPHEPIFRPDNSPPCETWWKGRKHPQR